MRNKNDFLGTGMKFPPQINPATGRFETVSGEQSVKESIYLILMTQKTERMGRPDFGASLMSYTFMDTSVTALSMMSREIANDIMTQEPRVEQVQVDTDPDMKKGCLIVNISYIIRNTNVKENLVFPFYLDSTWEGNSEDDYNGFDGAEE